MSGLNITSEHRQQLRDANFKKSSDAPGGAERRGVGLEGRQETLRKVLETVGENILSCDTTNCRKIS